MYVLYNEKKEAEFYSQGACGSIDPRHFLSDRSPFLGLKCD
jgi:hypothetical protein